MMWKAIGKSVIGTSHIAAGKKCEDVLQYQITYDSYSEELLICCASDGAGSAKYGAEAALSGSWLTGQQLELQSGCSSR